MIVLVIEDNLDLQEALIVIFESRFQAKVVAADTASAAIELLKTTPEIQFVCSDYNLKEGTGGEVFTYVKKHLPHLPFVLCSAHNPRDLAEFKEQSPTGNLVKPFHLETLIQLFQTIFDRSTPKREFCPIRLNTFLKINILICDVYIRLSDQKYLKIAHTTDAFSKEDHERYLSKNVDYLYIHSNDLEAFLNKFATDVNILSTTKTVTTQSAFNVAQYAQETLHQVISNFGFTPEAQALARSSTNLAVNSILQDPSLSEFTKKLRFERSNFLSTHSILLSQLSCLIASLMGWTSESTQYKLAFSSLLHDLTLEDDTMTLTELSIGLSKKPLRSHSLKLNPFEAHPLDAIELLKKAHGAPADADAIILAHHERPDASGFPSQLRSTELGALPTLFIVAHDLTNYLWLNEEKTTISAFLEQYSKDYDSGHFKKISAAMKQLPM